MEVQWGAGRYEQTASELAPVADAAVTALDLAGGERVLDVACGTGNAARVAADAGARVTGLDASPRLLDVARERVPEGDFVQGDAADLPYADGEFDAAVSVFGLIFASPPSGPQPRSPGSSGPAAPWPSRRGRPAGRSSHRCG